MADRRFGAAAGALASTPVAEPVWRRHAEALLGLLRNEALARGDAASFLVELATTAAEVLGVRRAGVWMLDATRTRLRPETVVPSDAASTTLPTAARHPAYFEALEAACVIDAEDVARDPRTAELYADGGGRTSGALLDAPIVLHGAVVGAVRHEHPEGPRRWTSEEVVFARAVADLAARALASADRARSEAALRASETRYRRLVEGVGDALWTVDRHGRILALNPAFEAATGLRTAAWIGQPFERLLHPDDLPAARAAHEHALAGRIPARFVARFRGADDDWRVGEILVAPDWRNGRVVGLVGAARDVTERDRAERRTRLLLAVADATAGAIDPDAAASAVVDELAPSLPCDAVALFRATADEAPRLAAARGVDAELAAAVAGILGGAKPVGARLCDGRVVVLPDLTTDADLAMARIAEQGVATLVAVPLRAHGAYLGALVVGWREQHPLQHATVELCEAVAGHVASVILAADAHVTLHVRARIDGALAAFADAAVAAPDPAALAARVAAVARDVLGGEHGAVYLARGRDAFTLAATADGDVPGPWLPEATFGELAEQLRAGDVREVAVDDAAVALVPYRGDAPAGRVLLVPLCLDGTLLGVHVVARLASRAFAAEERLIAAGVARLAAHALARVGELERLVREDRLKTDFVAALSHELRTPVNVLMGYGEMLLDEVYGVMAPGVRETVVRMMRSARVLGRLVGDALSLSRIDRGLVQIQRKPVALGELVAEAVATARDQPQASRVDVVAEVEADLPVIDSDRDKLAMILDNLVGNALKFTTAGRITVGARRCADGVELYVADTGVGIRDDEQALVFEPFRQGVAGRTAATGFGLGLHLVRRMAELLGGRVELDSTVGVGSTFRVILPTA